jgi:hypothetical protein
VRDRSSPYNFSESFRIALSSSTYTILDFRFCEAVRVADHAGTKFQHASGDLHSAGQRRQYAHGGNPHERTASGSRRVETAAIA